MHSHLFCAGLGPPWTKTQILSEEERRLLVRNIGNKPGSGIQVHSAIMGPLPQLRIEDGFLDGQSLKVATIDKQKFVLHPWSTLKEGNIFTGQRFILCNWNFALVEQGIGKSQNSKEKQEEDHSGVKAHHKEQDHVENAFLSLTNQFSCQ